MRDGDALRTRTLNSLQICLGLHWGDPAPHCWQGWTSLFGDPSRFWTPAKDQRSPLRRCFKPRRLRRAGCAGFASSCRSDFLKSSYRSPGDWRASCPAAYRSTHGHRHVRNWARIEIIHLTRESTLFLAPVLRQHKKIAASVKRIFGNGKREAGARLSAFGEGLDAPRVQHKAHHHREPEEEEQSL